MPTISDLSGFGSIADLVGKIVDRVWPDPTVAASLKADLAKAEVAGQIQDAQNAWDNLKAQAAIDQQEAASTSLFVAGWRPFIGWICGVSLGYAYVLQPLLVFIAKALHSDVVFPQPDLSTMMPLITAMLGLGAMRTVEKIRGAAPASHG